VLVEEEKLREERRKAEEANKTEVSDTPRHRFRIASSYPTPPGVPTPTFAAHAVRVAEHLGADVALQLVVHVYDEHVGAVVRHLSSA
jgi:hypothetical protein